jgi:hypothetical protein
MDQKGWSLIMFFLPDATQVFGKRNANLPAVINFPIIFLLQLLVLIMMAPMKNCEDFFMLR